MQDRHYVCAGCGLKWFVPASRADPTEPLECGECGAPLTRRDDPPADEFGASQQSMTA
jgi:DNA-directed RNA polymerase subunit RPC12/RpoP